MSRFQFFSVFNKQCLTMYPYRLMQVSAQKPLSYHKHMSGCIRLFFSFSRTIEGSTEGPSGFLSFWFWAHFCSCLCCRAFRILLCFQHLCNLLTKSRQLWRRRPWGWQKKQKCHLSALNVSWSKGPTYRGSTARTRVQWRHVSPAPFIM